MRRDAHRFAACAAACSAVALVLAAAPAVSAEGWKVRGAVVWVEPDLDFVEEDLLTRLSVTADGAFGLGVGAEYRLSDRLGLEFGLLYAEPEVEFRVEVVFPPLPGVPPLPSPLVFSVTDDLRFTPFSVGLNVHLTPDAGADFYLGPRVAYVFFGDLDLGFDAFGDSASLGVDDEFGYGAGAGLDVPFGGGGWFFHAAVDYLVVDFTIENSNESLDFDPFMVRAGFGVGF